MTVYYQYLDADSGKHFYFNSETQETIWEKPTGNVMICDPGTNQPINDDSTHTETEAAPDPEPKPEPELKRDPRLTKSNRKVTNHKKASSKGSLSKSKAVTATHKHSTSPQQGLQNTAFDQYIEEVAKRPGLETFTSFREVKAGGFLSRRQMSTEDILTCQSEPLKSPLLVDTPKAFEKDAVNAFKIILSYTGLSKGGSHTQLRQLVKTAQTPDSFLGDEIYCMLVKQIHNSQDLDALRKTYEVLLVMASIIAPVDADLVKIIPAAIAKEIVAGVPDPIIPLARMCFIRADAICAAGIPTLQISDKELAHIPEVFDKTTHTFGASIWEILLWQKSSKLSILIPIRVHEMAEKIIALGAATSVGIFRLPGNMNVIPDLQRMADKSQPFLNDIDINTCCSLFKTYFRSVPGGIIPHHLVKGLITLKKGDVIAYADNLPLPAKPVLMYLVGFLRRLTEFSDATKMGAENLAMVFAPNVIFIREEEDTLYVSQITQATQDFLTKLINEWDVSSIYPLQM